MKRSFGEQFTRLRKEKKFTQERIAELLGVSPQAVSKWENDLSYPDIELLADIAELLDITIDDLLGAKRNRVALVPEEKRKSVDELLLKIVVNSNDGDKVRINVPVVLLIAGLELGIEPQITMKHDSLKSIDFKQLVAMIEKGVIGKLVEIESADGDIVEIFVE